MVPLYALIQVADHKLAFPAEQVIEFIQAQQCQLSRVPLQDPALQGLVQVRDKVVPLYDTLALLGLGPKGKPTPCYLLLQTTRGEWALTIDARWTCAAWSPRCTKSFRPVWTCRKTSRGCSS